MAAVSRTLRVVTNLPRIPQETGQLSDFPSVICEDLAKQSNPTVVARFTFALLRSPYPKKHLAQIIHVAAQTIFCLKVKAKTDVDDERFPFLEQLLNLAVEPGPEQDCILQQAQVLANQFSDKGYFPDLAIYFLEFPLKDSKVAKSIASSIFQKMQDVEQYCNFFTLLILGCSNYVERNAHPRIPMDTVEAFFPLVEEALKSCSEEFPLSKAWRRVFSTFINTPNLSIDEDFWKEGVLKSNAVLKSLQDLKKECDHSSNPFLSQLKEWMNPKQPQVDINSNTKENARLIFFLIKKVCYRIQLSEEGKQKKAFEQAEEFHNFKTWIISTFGIYPENLEKSL